MRLRPSADRSRGSGLAPVAEDALVCLSSVPASNTLWQLKRLPGGAHRHPGGAHLEFSDRLLLLGDLLNRAGNVFVAACSLRVTPRVA